MFLLLILMFSGCSNDNPTGGSVVDIKKEPEIKDCPFDCCISGEYKIKDCGKYYECLNNKCETVDSDNDGLSDVEEIKLGTNPKLHDSDGDTLSDYQEYKIMKTDPLDRNTDKDRYNDNEDPNPLNVNSAKIEIDVIKNEGHWDETLKNEILPILGCLAIYGGEVSVGDISGIVAALCAKVMGVNSITDLATKNVYFRNIEIQTKNVGNDYSSYIRYRIKVYTKHKNKPKELFRNMDINIGSLKSGEYDINKLSFPSKIGEYAVGILKDMLEGKTGEKEYILEVESLEYEKF